MLRAEAMERPKPRRRDQHEARLARLKKERAEAEARLERMKNYLQLIELRLQRAEERHDH